MFSKCLFLFLLCHFFVSTSFAKNDLQVEIDGKKYASDVPIMLNSDAHEIIFRFPSKENCTYLFELNGLENDWKTNVFPEARYTNLTGGKYVFHGRMVQNTKIINEFTAKIVINETFWEKWWFWPSIGVYLIIVLGVAYYLFFLYDFRNKLKVQHLRNQIAADLHDEVGSNLNSIAIFIEVLKRKIGKEKIDLLSILEKITANSEESVSLMRETVWAINPENDSSEKLFERMESLGFEILSLMKIEFIFENKSQNQHFSLSMEQRRNIYLIYKEAINNITKHTKATKVWVRIFIENRCLKISVKDNGCGFDRTQVFKGNGLKNFENRGKNNRIEVFIASEIRKGTEIIIEAGL